MASGTCPQCRRDVPLILGRKIGAHGLDGGRGACPGVGRAALSPARQRALDILKAHGPMVAADFARKMWPDSIQWRRRSRRSSTAAGGAVAAGLIMSAGAFLGRMRDAGLVRGFNRSASSYQTWWEAK